MHLLSFKVYNFLRVYNMYFEKIIKSFIFVTFFNLLINKDKISVSSKNIEFGDSFEEIQISNANFNERFDFLLNVRYLNHILKATDCDTITFNFINVNKPILITDKKEENLKFLILPLRH